jgi:hypothetical protein
VAPGWHQADAPTSVDRNHGPEPPPEARASLACRQRPTIDSEIESTLAGEPNDSVGDGGVHSPSTPVGSRSPTRSLKPGRDAWLTDMEGGSRTRS